MPVYAASMAQNGKNKQRVTQHMGTHILTPQNVQISQKLICKIWSYPIHKRTNCGKCMTSLVEVMEINCFTGKDKKIRKQVQLAAVRLLHDDTTIHPETQIQTLLFHFCSCQTAMTKQNMLNNNHFTAITYDNLC